MKILIIKLGALGDVINTFPLAVHLKKTLECEIHWLVAPLSLPLVANHPCVDKAILFNKKEIFPSLPRVWNEIRSQDYDLCLDLQRILKSGLFAWATRARRRIGFDRKRCKELTWLFPFDRIPPANPTAHMLDQYMEFADYLEIAPPATIQWELPRSQALPPGLPETFVVLNIGATKEENQWPKAHFAHLVDAIDKELGMTCVLTGGPEDRSSSQGIMDVASAKAINLVGETRLPELVEVLAKAACTISCDTGPMHLARALGTPLIALFGPSNPHRTGPYKGLVIKKGDAARPSSMEDIRPKDVMEKLIPLMEGR